MVDNVWIQALSICCPWHQVFLLMNVPAVKTLCPTWTSNNFLGHQCLAWCNMIVLYALYQAKAFMWMTRHTQKETQRRLAPSYHCPVMYLPRSAVNSRKVAAPNVFRVLNITITCPALEVPCWELGTCSTAGICLGESAPILFAHCNPAACCDCQTSQPSSWNPQAMLFFSRMKFSMKHSNACQHR